MADLFPSNLPAAALRSARLRLVAVEGDGMAPTLRPRDFALCLPVTGYVGEGIYLLADPLGGEQFYRVEQILGGGDMHLMRDNPAYRGSTVPAATFAEHVLAIVVADVRMRAPHLLQDLAQP